ncbi:hypothetical protein V1509DRAFT_619329 [Lipomyces kononenkoae]
MTSSSDLSVNLPPLHGRVEPFVPPYIGTAHKTGVPTYICDGINRWLAVHRGGDAPSLYRLTVEKAPPGSYLHYIGDQDIPTCDH